MNFRRWCEAVQRFILLPSNSRRVDHLLLGSIDAKNHSVNFRSWCEAVRRSSCNLLFSFCSFRSSESNRCFSSPSYRNNRQVLNPLNPLLISLKFLHVISILCKTEWWWELSTWSQKIEDKSNRHFNKFSLQLLLEMYGDNKTEFWSFSHHQGKQAPIYHNSYLFLWAESCRPLPTPPPPRFPLLDSLWHGKANVQNVCSRIFAGVNSQVISEFQKTLTFKTWPSAKPSLWKWVLFARE